jgi:gamma-glutamylcyclotransferase (GGCT)/AIG2-like uncharacterized protein YtfP
MAQITSLFVYGSLIDAALRQRLLGRVVNVREGRLLNYVRRRGRYFYLAEQPGGWIDGVILSGLTEDDFGRLDVYEEVPELYRRIVIEAQDGSGGAVRCWCYFATAKVTGG